MSDAGRPSRRAPAALLAVVLGATLTAVGPAPPANAALASPANPASPAGPPAGSAAPDRGRLPDGSRCEPPAGTVFRAVPWAQRRLAPQRVWMLTRGRSVTVAIVDTGVSRSAPALAGRVLPGRDVRTGGPADDDCAGHGTFVAGLVAARPAAAGGEGGPADSGGFAGVAPEARILPIRVSDRAEDVHPDLLASGIEAAVRGGATVIAVVATAPFGSPALRRAVELADEQGAMVVASALTMRAQHGDVAYPAALPDVVSVTPIGSDGRPKAAAPANRPTLAAPGADLVSIAPTGRGNVQGSGANLAIGFVAGTLALMREYRPRQPAADIRNRLTVTTDPVTGSGPAVGSGIVDPVAAVTAVLPAATERAPAPPKPDPVVLPSVPVVDHRPIRAAASWAGGVLVAGIAVCLVGAIIVRGRRRNWSANP